MPTPIVVLDPTGQHGGKTSEQLIGMAGFLPGWATDPDFMHLDLKEAMEEQYGLGPLREMTGGRVNNDLSYSYPGDPDIFPILLVSRCTDGGEEHEVLLQYEYGLTGILGMRDGSAFMTRMD